MTSEILISYRRSGDDRDEPVHSSGSPPSPRESMDFRMGWSMTDIAVEFSEKYDRRGSNIIDEHIDSIWARRKTENPNIYNASKFRLKDACQPGRAGDGEPSVLLRVGMTDYRDFVCTNSNFAAVERLFEDGRGRFNDMHACMSDALGICAVVLTKDDYVLFVRRSFTVFEAQGMVDFPGGHSEPEEMMKKCGLNPRTLRKAEGKDVVYEIFYSMTREVRDEINLPEASLSWPVLMCIMRNGSVGLKPHISFYIKCNLVKDEVHRLYKIGGPEAEESSELFFIHIQLLRVPVNEVVSKIDAAVRNLQKGESDTIRAKDLLSADLSKLENSIGKMSACGMKTLEIFLEIYKRATALVDK